MKLKFILSVIFITFITTSVGYLSSSSYVYNYLIEKEMINPEVDIEKVKDNFMLLNILVTSFILGIKYNLYKYNNENLRKQRDKLIKMYKDIIEKVLTNDLSKAYSNFNIRIFVPKQKRKYQLCDKFNIKCNKYFRIINIPIIANDDITRDLEFRVNIKPQGLVGLCYTEKGIIFDDDLKNTNSNKYNLNPNQIFRTESLEWSVCCPVINKNDEISVIVAFDGNQKINFGSRDKEIVKSQIVAFSRNLYDVVPELFRR